MKIVKTRKNVSFGLTESRTPFTNKFFSQKLCFHRSVRTAAIGYSSPLLTFPTNEPLFEKKRT